MAKRTENKKENGCYAIGKWFAWAVALLVTSCSPKGHGNLSFLSRYAS